MGVDGIVRVREASGATRAAARDALRDLLVGPPDGSGEFLSGESTVAQLASAWLAELRFRDEIGPETYDYYRRGVETLIIPGLGDQRLCDLRPVAVKQFYNQVLTTVGHGGQTRRTPSRPVWAHKVFALMLRYAVEVGALDVSPVRDLRPPPRRVPEVRVLSVALFHEIRAVVVAFDSRPQYGPARSHRLADVFDLLAASGARIGEILALRWCDVDLEATPATISICGTLLPPRDGLPLRRKEGTKTPAALRKISLPDFATETLRRLKMEAVDAGGLAPVFATRNGTWISPNNVRREWRECRAGHDWEWVTPHTFRKTVATLIDGHYCDPETGGTEGAGAPIAAAVLGHSSEAITRAYYIKARMRRAPDVSAVLEDAFANPVRAEAS